MDRLTRKRQGTVSNHCAKASLPTLLVLHHKRRDDSDNVLLLTARELRDIFKNLVHLAGWTDLPPRKLAQDDI